MEFTDGHLYHIYNRGNDKQRLFFQERNYHYFFEKVEKFVFPFCDILSYVLMPNHFHFMIHANEITEQIIKRGMITTNPVSEGFRKILSSFAQGVNKQEFKTGSRFQQNTKSKCLTLKHSDYSYTCFNYIHQNPYKAGLVEKMEDWRHSSFGEYMEMSTHSLCNKPMATDLLDLNMNSFYQNSYGALTEDAIKAIF